MWLELGLDGRQSLNTSHRLRKRECSRLKNLWMKDTLSLGVFASVRNTQDTIISRGAESAWWDVLQVWLRSLRALVTRIGSGHWGAHWRGEKTCFLNSILKKSTGLFVQSKTRSEFSVWIAGTQSTKHVNSRTAVDHFFRTALTTPKDHIDSTQRALSKQQADAGRSEGRPARWETLAVLAENFLFLSLSQCSTSLLGWGRYIALQVEVRLSSKPLKDPHSLLPPPPTPSLHTTAVV